ncbi:MAG: hypothetical protein R3264_13295 [Anaerolineae bacterium]|nr:hypothetical protein [Anaerolineae bacterium]
MELDNKSGSAALDTLYWRDEILQVMYWLQGEGLGEVVGAGDLQVFLAGDLATIQFYLEQFTEEGYLNRHPDPVGLLDKTRYSLSEDGRREGGRRFRDEFEGMQKSGHGECSADCVCQTTGNHADCPSHNHNH